MTPQNCTVFIQYVLCTLGPPAAFFDQTNDVWYDERGAEGTRNWKCDCEIVTFLCSVEWTFPHHSNSQSESRIDQFSHALDRSLIFRCEEKAHEDTLMTCNFTSLRQNLFSKCDTCVQIGKERRKHAGKKEVLQRLDLQLQEHLKKVGWVYEQYILGNAC